MRGDEFMGAVATALNAVGITILAVVFFSWVGTVTSASGDKLIAIFALYMALSCKLAWRK